MAALIKPGKLLDQSGETEPAARGGLKNLAGDFWSPRDLRKTPVILLESGFVVMLNALMSMKLGNLIIGLSCSFLALQSASAELLGPLRADPDTSFYLYRPVGLDPEIEAPVMIWTSPDGANDQTLEPFYEAAETLGMIIATPVEARLEGQFTLPNNFGHVCDVLDELVNNYNVSRKAVHFGGEKSGGRADEIAQFEKRFAPWITQLVDTSPEDAFFLAETLLEKCDPRGGFKMGITRLHQRLSRNPKVRAYALGLEALQGLSQKKMAQYGTHNEPLYDHTTKNLETAVGRLASDFQGAVKLQPIFKGLAEPTHP